MLNISRIKLFTIFYISFALSDLDPAAGCVERLTGVASCGVEMEVS